MYKMTSKHHSTVGHWERCESKTLEEAKREASERFGDGYQDHKIVIAEDDERSEVVTEKLVGASSWS